LKALAYSSRQRTHPVSKPQLASDTAVVQAFMLQRRTVAPPSSSAGPPLIPRPTHHVLVLSSTSQPIYVPSHSRILLQVTEKLYIIIMWHPKNKVGRSHTAGMAGFGRRSECCVGSALHCHIKHLVPSALLPRHASALCCSAHAYSLTTNTPTNTSNAWYMSSSHYPRRTLWLYTIRDR
jgi:hypothetical protein